MVQKSANCFVLVIKTKLNGTVQIVCMIMQHSYGNTLNKRFYSQTIKVGHNIELAESVCLMNLFFQKHSVDQNSGFGFAEYNVIDS